MGMVSGVDPRFSGGSTESLVVLERYVHELIIRFIIKCFIFLSNRIYPIIIPHMLILIGRPLNLRLHYLASFLLLVNSGMFFPNHTFLKFDFLFYQTFLFIFERYIDKLKSIHHRTRFDSMVQFTTSRETWCEVDLE